MTPWSDIISRLEKLSGADQLIDGAIADALGIDRLECCGCPNVCNGPDPYEECCGNPVELAPAPYTASLDAALTLVPEGAGVALDRASAMGDGSHPWRCYVGGALPTDTVSIAVVLPRHSELEK